MNSPDYDELRSGVLDFDEKKASGLQSCISSVDHEHDELIGGVGCQRVRQDGHRGS